MRKSTKDLSGKRFGYLVAQTFTGYIKHAAEWECICDCGNRCRKTSSQLKQGEKTISCGCMIRAWSRGRVFSDEHRKKLSESHSGPKCYNWKGGKVREKYNLDFNRKLRESIRDRDGHLCQECGISEESLGHKLHVHHIDYDKNNISTDNLVSLCASCHGKTNYDRLDWINYFKDKI